MPVLLVTLHAYRSWTEDHANGYIQHGKGIKRPQARLARWRGGQADQPSNRFEREHHPLLHALAIDVCREEDVTLHAASVTPTHVHLLVSFGEPICDCGLSRRVDTRGSGIAADVNPSAGALYHPKSCSVWQRGHALAVRFKRVAGGQLSTATEQPGRRWFSRGEDISPVHDRRHYTHHVTAYLPRHEREGGTVRVYGDGGAPAPTQPTD